MTTTDSVARRPGGRTAGQPPPAGRPTRTPADTPGPGRTRAPAPPSHTHTPVLPPTPPPSSPQALASWGPLEAWTGPGGPGGGGLLLVALDSIARPRTLDAGLGAAPQRTAAATPGRIAGGSAAQRDLDIGASTRTSEFRAAPPPPRGGASRHLAPVISRLAAAGPHTCRPATGSRRYWRGLEGWYWARLRRTPPPPPPPPPPPHPLLAVQQALPTPPFTYP